MPAANKHRGEVQVKLAGHDWTARPSWTAIAAIEARTGIGIIELSVKCYRAQMTVTQMVIVLAECLKAAGHNASEEKVGEMVVEEGVAALAEPVSRLLNNALTGGKEDEPEGNGGAAVGT